MMYTCWALDWQVQCTGSSHSLCAMFLGKALECETLTLALTEFSAGTPNEASGFSDSLRLELHFELYMHVVSIFIV